MPLYDYSCKCGYSEKDTLIQNPTQKILEETAVLKCPNCSKKSLVREFPLPRKPHVDWTNPVFSYKHGKLLGSTKAVDIAERQLKEPNIDKYAEAYMREENKLNKEN